MEYRYVTLETGSEPEIYKVPLNRTAQLLNQYSNRNVKVFETLKEATAAALAIIASAEEQSRSRISVFSTGPLPESEALRRRIADLTEDQVQTFIL